jgi:hypothetical protein
MNEQKNIKIVGKHTNDIFNLKKEERIRIGNVIETDYNETKSLLLKNDEVVTKSIDKKILCYKYQDIKKKIHDINTIISFQEVKDKLINCDFKCNYCNKIVKVLYKIVRDPLQWTLDRIDNKKNHSNENTLISCLKCNIKRRNINKDSFEFTKNLVIVKM